MDVVLFVMGAVQFAYWVNMYILRLSVDVHVTRGHAATAPVAQNPKRKRKAKPR